MRSLHGFVFPIGALCVLPALSADDSVPTAGPVESLPEVRVVSPRVANQEPATTFAMPVSGLTFEPLVDVQARNMAEGQADISIRGGTFENTGFSIGALPVYDPQTGHLFGELPIAPALLGPVEVRTGLENARQGWGGTAGNVGYDWGPVRDGGFVSAGGGDNHLLRGEVYVGAESDKTVAGRRLAADVDIAYSESDGSRPFGDHQFERYNVRLQLSDDVSQTDLFAGYQHKFFGWTNLYAAPFNSNETEEIETTLVGVNHRVEFGDEGYFQAGVYHRHNVDDFEFNRSAAIPDNSYNITEVSGFAFDGRRGVAERTALIYRGGVIADELTKTRGLTFGNYDDRTQYYAGLSAEHTVGLAAEGRELVFTAGANYDDSNRDAGRLSPLAGVELRQADSAIRRVYLTYAETSQLPTYQALNASPFAGLFRGDANLPRAVAKNLELGADAAVTNWSLSAAVFARDDEDLLDYIYNPALAPVAVRQAVSGDLRTIGFETVARRQAERYDLTIGYTFLHKDEDYLAANQASFYAFNYAEHRLTAAVVWRVTGDLELRMDNEYRIQEENTLRRRNDEPLLSALGLVWRVPGVAGLSLNAQVDNLWNTYYEEVPQVPGARRTWSAGATYVW